MMGELEPEGESVSVDTCVPHIARVYDYWLGGKDNFAVDRAAAEQVIETFPDILVSVRAQRAFLGRTVHYLAAEAGIRQFLDLGTGLPSGNNTHEAAQRVAPQARVVYVDNDPIVLLHARALLASRPEGATAYIDADLRDTRTILAQAARNLDFGNLSAIMLLGCCTASRIPATRPRSWPGWSTPCRRAVTLRSRTRPATSPPTRWPPRCRSTTST